MRAWIALAIALCVTAPANALDIKFAPADSVILHQAHDGNVNDLVVHAIGIATKPGETFAIERIQIALLRGDYLILTGNIDPSEALASMNSLVTTPEKYLVPSQLLSPGGVQAFFGREVSAASDPTRLGSAQYMFTTRHYFGVSGVPDKIRVTVEGKTASGTPAAVTAELPVRRHQPKIDYRLPLDGAWMMHAPMIASHHRLNAATEFAVDFFKTDAEGRNFVGDPLNAANALGFGAPVHAAAGGEVVFVIADDAQDRSIFAPRPGETQKARTVRVMSYMDKRFAKDLRRAVAGNIVTIRHEANGAVEYTSYGHLKAGSVRVKKGDRVTQGQVIGEVGDTGDSPAVHLHFQVNAGPDAFTSQSLPATFVDLKYPGHSRDPGRFIVRSEKPPP
jgi:hypothetical protein